VRDGVVHLARDPGALLDHRGVGARLTLGVQGRGQLRQLGGPHLLAAHQCAEPPGRHEDDAEEDLVPERGADGDVRPDEDGDAADERPAGAMRRVGVPGPRHGDEDGDEPGAARAGHPERLPHGVEGGDGDSAQRGPYRRHDEAHAEHGGDHEDAGRVRAEPVIEQCLVGGEQRHHGSGDPGDEPGLAEPGSEHGDDGTCPTATGGSAVGRTREVAGSVAGRTARRCLVADPG
jgi:hypothetical protein